MKYDCIIWDWNGTLADDMSVSLAAVNKILAERGREPISAAEYYSFMDTPIIKFYEKLFDLSSEDYRQLIKEFNDNYDMLLRGGEVGEGVKKAVAAFTQAGVRQIVLSSCENGKLCRLLREYGLDGCFEAVLGANDFHAGSKTGRAMEYFAVSGTDPRRAVVIGDTLHDAETARAIGCDCVLAASGHQDRASLETSGYPVAQTAEDAASIVLASLSAE